MCSRTCSSQTGLHGVTAASMHACTACKCTCIDYLDPVAAGGVACHECLVTHECCGLGCMCQWCACGIWLVHAKRWLLKAAVLAIMLGKSGLKDFVMSPVRMGML